MITFTRISYVVSKAYDYTTLDTYYINEKLFKLLNCLLTHNINKAKHNEDKDKLNLLSSIQESISDNSARYNQHSLDENYDVVYIYIPGEIDDIFMDRLLVDGKQTLFIFVSDIIKEREGYKFIFKICNRIIRTSMPNVNIIARSADSMSTQILLFAPLTITLYHLNLEDEELKKDVFNHLRSGYPISLVEDIYKETRQFTITELLDNAYILAVD